MPEQIVLAREAQRFHEQSILQGRAYGELSHPSTDTFRELNRAALSHQAGSCPVCPVTSSTSHAASMQLQ